MTLPDLRLPFPDTPVDHSTGKILDPVRQIWVTLTPEEWVRQHVIRWVEERVGAPRGLIGVEQGLEWEGQRRRADVVVWDRLGSPWLLVECKAPSVRLSQATLDQIARYASVLRAPHLVVTNGLALFAACWDAGKAQYLFAPDIPLFPSDN